MVSQWWKFGKDKKADKIEKNIYMYIWNRYVPKTLNNHMMTDPLKKIHSLVHSDGQTVVEYDSFLPGRRSFWATRSLSLVSSTLSSVSLSLPSATVGSKDIGPDFLCKGKPTPLSCRELSRKSSSEEWNDSSSPIKWLTMWIPSKGGWPEKPLWPFRHLSCQNKIQVNILNWGNNIPPAARKQAFHV